MSNSLAIAAVTATLRNVLEPRLDAELPGTQVTARPPDRARNNLNGSQVNLFLYHTLPNAALRNQDMPGRVRPGETGYPALALNLYYLVTAYGEGDDDYLNHQLLGRAMGILHDHTLLSKADIEAATGTDLPGSDLHQQVDRIRITQQPLSIEEISKLWATFQTPYRISASYEVSVVLIESRRATVTPLPVLTRGEGDRGVMAQANLTPPVATLQSAVLRNQQPSLAFGNANSTQPDLILKGHHLAGETVQIRFQHPRLAQPLISTNPTHRLEKEIRLSLPAPGRFDDESAPVNQWLAGVYSVQVRVENAGQVQTSNALGIAIAPRIDPDFPIQTTRSSGDEVTITLRCMPAVSVEQRVSLLVGDRELAWDKPQTSNNREHTLSFSTHGLSAGRYAVRLRVDGIDSWLVNRSVQPPAFDHTQQIQLS